MAINIPDIISKYITFFPDLESYNAAKGSFIEVNWSAVRNAEHPDQVLTPYQPSTRPTHGFEPVDGDTVKPDSDVRMFYYTLDHIFKTFFLEIIWGYSGWEWKDYEYTSPITSETTVLKGGNLYKVKEITEVPSIPDGYRLQHINNFLNSQNKVTHVGTFDAVNIISMLNAYNVGVKTQAFLLDTYNYPNVENINGAFTGLALSIANDNVLYLGKVINAGTAFNNINIGYYDTNIIKIEMPLLQTASNLFKGVSIYSSIDELDLNEVFVGDTLNNISDFSKFMDSARHYDAPNNRLTVKLDLTDTNVPSSTVLDLSSFCENFNMKEFDLKVSNPVNLSHALATSISSGVKVLSIHGNEQLIRDISHGFERASFGSTVVFPYTAPINETVNDNFEFYGCSFGSDISYDFSPNHTLKTTYGHFDRAGFGNTTCTFYNVDYVNAFIFNPVSGFSHFPNTLWNSNITYVKPAGVGESNPYIDYTRFKYIQVGGSISTIAPQTIYACSQEVFTGNVLLSNSIQLHICQAGVTFNTQYENFYDGGERYRIGAFRITNNTTTALPLIYFHVLSTENDAANTDFLSTGGIDITGNLIEDITINVVDETDGSNYPYINLKFNCPNIRTININHSFRCNVDWDITELEHLDMSNFETLLIYRQEGYHYNGAYTYKSGWFKCYQSQWNQLSSSCQDHCVDIFTRVDLVQEEE